MEKPIIGITTAIESDSISLRPHYIEAVTDFGGVPMLLAKNNDSQSIKEQVEILDGLYLTGEDDINPGTYGEEPHPALEAVEHGRGEYEIEVIKHAYKRNIPILGICRGSQLLNSLSGGTMYQDLNAQSEGDDLIQHKQQSDRDYLQHSVLIEENSRLREIVDTDKIRVNSHHHQANKTVDNDDFIVSGRAPDGVIEALESTGDKFIMGLQFHPEDSYKFDEPSKKILEAFLSEAQNFRNTK